MKRFVGTLCLIMAAVLLSVHAVRAGGGGYSELDCGDTKENSGTEVQVGHHCTSNQGGCSQSNRDKARTDANKDMNTRLGGAYRCTYCLAGDPEQGFPCVGSFVLTPAGGFADSDCLCSTAGECQGNPLKTLIVMTCTATIGWSMTCSNPCQ